MAYAQNTSVSVPRSRAEIEDMLAKAGCIRFAVMTEPTGAVMMFELEGRRIRIAVPSPNADERDITHTESGRARSAGDVKKHLEQAGRARWRSMVLILKAKLEAVSAGVTTIEDEFMPHIVLPNGQTFGDMARPAIADAYSSGEVPPMMLEYRPEG